MSPADGSPETSGPTSAFTAGQGPGGPDHMAPAARQTTGSRACSRSGSRGRIGRSCSITAAGRQEASMPTEPLGRFPAARTSDCDEAQAAMAATFLPLRMRTLGRPGPGGVGMRLNALRVADVTVAYARFGRAVEVATAEA